MNGEPDISRNGLSLVIFSIMLGWYVDLLSSWIGSMAGGTELSPFFWIFPPAWMMLFIGLAVVVYKWKTPPYAIRAWIMLCIIAVSLVPGVSNTVQILELMF